MLVAVFMVSVEQAFSSLEKYLKTMCMIHPHRKEVYKTKSLGVVLKLFSTTYILQQCYNKDFSEHLFHLNGVKKPTEIDSVSSLD